MVLVFEVQLEGVGVGLLDSDVDLDPRLSGVVDELELVFVHLLEDTVAHVLVVFEDDAGPCGESGV